MNHANIIMLSGAFRIKLALLERLKTEPFYSADISVTSITAAQLKFVRNMPNVLILDTDTHDTDYKMIKLLMEKYLLYVVTLGRRVAYSDPAVQFVLKPAVESAESVASAAAIIIQKVKSLLNAVPSFAARDLNAYVDAKHKLVAIASSTGGTEALPVLLSELPKDIPPIIIVQHMPSMFTKQLADRIDKMSAINVKEAQNGEFIKGGTAYIAPGDFHMRLVIRQQRLALECFFGEKMNGVRPAADILFDSVARISGSNAIGVILTGMGADGARGLVEMHKKGAKVIGQDKDSCVVYGMPRAAWELGAVDFQIPLKSIAGRLVKLCAE